MLTPEENAIRYQLYNQGLIDEEIAEKVGVTPSAITQWRHTNKLPANGGGCGFGNKEKDGPRRGNMKLSDIKPGMTIEYRGRVYGHGNLMGKDKTKTGIIKQVTPNLIAVQGQRYPDTILVNDLLSGQVQITNLKGEGEMARPKREAPPKAKLLALFEEHEGKIAPIAEELKASWAQARNWLIEAGIIDSDYVYQKQTPTPEPEQAANQEPDEGEGESATDSIPYSVERIENIGKDIPPVKMPIGCSLPLEDSTEPQDEVMAESDTGQEKETVEYYPDWPPKDPIERALLETTMNARFAVRRVLNDPVALALMKQVLESGVV
jgi:hypothetical protein